MTNSPFLSGFHPGAAARGAYRSGVITPSTAICAAGGSTLTIRHHRICTARSVVVTHRTYIMAVTATTRTPFSTETWHLSYSLRIDICYEERGKSIICTPFPPLDSAPNGSAGIRGRRCCRDSDDRIQCNSCRTGRRPCGWRSSCQVFGHSSDSCSSRTWESASSQVVARGSRRASYYATQPTCVTIVKTPITIGQLCPIELLPRNRPA